MKIPQKTQILVSMILLALSLYGCGGGGGGNGEDNNDQTQSNTAPEITGDSPDYVRVGESYRYQPSASDVDNDTLFFTAENIPTWASFDVNTGEITGTPSEVDVQIYRNVTISANDGSASTTTEPFDIKVIHAEVGEDNITFDPSATRVDTAEGFDIIGDVSIVVGNTVTELSDADLQFEFDEEGNLLDLTGESLLPPVIGDNFSLDASVRAIIGLYTGAEINASLEIGPESEPGILLKDDIQYIVYFLETGLDLTFHAGDGEDEEISLGLAGSRVYIVSDPTDPFLYYFGDIAGAGLGFGYSHNALIPWEPLFEPDSSVAFSPLESFDGEAVLKGIFPTSAYGIFDILQFTGVAVCQSPQLLSCNKPSYAGIASALAGTLAAGDNIDPSQQFKVGINGTVDLNFGILGVDLFRYHLLDASSMMDIGTTRQKLAIQGVIDTEESEQPAWLPFEPVPDLGLLTVGNIFADVAVADGQGDFGISLYGEIDSFFPPARMAGAIDIDAQGMRMSGIIEDPANPITVSAIVDAEGLEANVVFGYDIQGNINQITNQGLDNAVDTVNQAIEDLDNATTDYNGAVSLDGFRSQIPTIVDEAIAILNALPQRVYNDVYNAAKSGIDNAEVTYSVVGISYTFDVNDYINSDSAARASANTIRSRVQADVDQRIPELENLRTEAERAEDTPQFRAALKSALELIASKPTLSVSVLVRRTIDFGFPVGERRITFYNNTLTYTIISTSTRDDLLIAAANVDDIDPAFTVMIDSQTYLDSLPTEQEVEAVRDEVESGIRTIPTFRGAGYRVGRDFSQQAYIDLGTDRIDIEFNLLDPVSIISDLADLIASQLVSD